MSFGSVKIYVGVTDLEWFEYLSVRNPDEVNFWQPGGRSRFRALQPGDGARTVQISTVEAAAMMRRADWIMADLLMDRGW